MFPRIIKRIYYRLSVLGIQMKFLLLSVYHQGKINTPNLYHGQQFILDIEGRDFLIEGPNLKFKNFCNISIRKNARLSIGINTGFNNYCSINCLGEITIGSNCLFGEGVKLYDHNHRFRDLSVPINKQGYKIGSIRIGHNCWIGTGVVILKDVVIGDNVIIGAGIVINEDIPSNTIVTCDGLIKKDTYGQ